MKTHKYIYIVVVILFGLWSCSDDEPTLDDDDAETVELIATGFVSTIEENPQQGDALGQVQVNQTEGTQYQISMSDPQGAVTVNANGEVLVDDPSQFDFESRNAITATVLVSNLDAQTTAEINIAITDADDLETLLTTSREDFMAANGSWVEVTQQEYELLSERILQTQRVGVPEAAFDLNEEIMQTAGDITVANTIDIPMPSGSYVYAFKYYSTSGTNNNSNGQVRPKVSEESPTTGYIGRGPLPPHESGMRYFVNAVSVATASQSYLAMYSPYSMGWVENDQSGMRYRFGNGSSMTNVFGGVQVLFQALVTNQKQWD